MSKAATIKFAQAVIWMLWIYHEMVFMDSLMIHQTCVTAQMSVIIFYSLTLYSDSYNS